ncbi:MAG TPA: acyl-CoA dehydrogenase family protein [Blastocatellia bacterium]|nr:acyl-CoA dehydrogenase family protein [Blastocatellia bacterium]
MSFEGIDFLGLDSELTEEERLARDSVRRFAQSEIVPVISKCFEEGRFPVQIIPQLAELGVLGANLPEAYGCAGMNNVSYGLVMQELEAADSGVRSFASVQGALCMYPIFEFGDEEQRCKYLPEMAAGKLIGCFGLTEPNFGSNPGGMLTRAEKVTGGWVINGAKAWITNGSIADVGIIWAKASDGDGETIKGFLVEKGVKGFSTRETKNKLSLRASITSELFFEDCFVKDKDLLAGTGGIKSPLMCLTQARYGIAWGAVGAAMSCFDTALKYAKERIQFGRPIGGFQLTQRKLVEMMSEITQAQLLCLRIGRLKEQGRLKPVQVSFAKMNNVAMALECARVSRSILGANGIIGDYPIMRHMCNLESVLTYEGTHDIHTLILGEYLTGLNAFE